MLTTLLVSAQKAAGGMAEKHEREGRCQEGSVGDEEPAAGN